MDGKRLAYYVGIPAVTFGLCAFSFYLGWERGRQAGPQTDRPVVRPAEPKTHEVAEDLTFFKTLKGGEDLPKESLPSQADSKKKVVEEKRPERAKDKEDAVVQVSAFRDVGKAHELIDELGNLGYPAFTKTPEPGAETWYRVFVGPYRSKEKATSVLEELKRNGYGQGFVKAMAKK